MCVCVSSVYISPSVELYVSVTLHIFSMSCVCVHMAGCYGPTGLKKKKKKKRVSISSIIKHSRETHLKMRRTPSRDSSMTIIRTRSDITAVERYKSGKLSMDSKSSQICFFFFEARGRKAPKPLGEIQRPLLSLSPHGCYCLYCCLHWPSAKKTMYSDRDMDSPHATTLL